MPSSGPPPRPAPRRRSGRCRSRVPRRPIQRSQPNVTPASTETRAVTPAAAPRRGRPASCCGEQLPARHRDDARARCPRPASSVARPSSATCTSEPVAMRISVGSPVGVGEHVGAARAAAVGGALRAVEHGRSWREARAPSGRRRARARSATPARSRSRRRAEHDEVRDRAQRHQVLDRLVRRAVLAEADRVVRPDEDRPAAPISAASRTGGPHVVGEDEERRAERRAARRGRPCRWRSTPMRVLAHAEVEVAAAESRPRRRRALDRSVLVDAAEVGGAADQLGHRRGERVAAPCPTAARVAIASSPASNVGSVGVPAGGQLAAPARARTPPRARGAPSRRPRSARCHAALQLRAPRCARVACAARPRPARRSARPRASRAPSSSRATSSSPSGAPWASRVPALFGEP